MSPVAHNHELDPASHPAVTLAPYTPREAVPAKLRIPPRGRPSTPTIDPLSDRPCAYDAQRSALAPVIA